MAELSHTVTQRLIEAQRTQGDYLPNQEILDRLHTVDFIAVIAAAAMGKSTVMNVVTGMDGDFRRVGGGTTRDPDERDEENLLHYEPHTDEGISALLDKIARRELVQYMIHPKTGKIYYTESTDYVPGKFNMKDVTTSGLQTFRRLGFASLHEIGIIAQPAVWHNWFASRYPEVNNERTKRLQEGIASTQAQKNIPHLQLIENINGNPQHAAQEIIELARSTTLISRGEKELLDRLLVTMRSMG